MFAIYCPISSVVHREGGTVISTHYKIKNISELSRRPLSRLKPEHVLPVISDIKTQLVMSRSPSGCVTGYFTGNYSLDQIISHESGGNSCSTNSNDCFGLLQACPGAPLRDACGGNPDCQIRWFTANKLGSRTWDQVWALWQTQGWW